MTRLNINDARCEALFASWLQRSDSPTAERVAEAISRAVRQFGTRGCAGQMAQEFGDHPEAAADRMRWVRQLAAPEHRVYRTDRRSAPVTRLVHLRPCLRALSHGLAVASSGDRPGRLGAGARRVTQGVPVCRSLRR